MPQYPDYMWFRPEILGYLYERGTSRQEIFRALKPEVKSVDGLQKALTQMYPEREELIADTFARYGR